MSSISDHLPYFITINNIQSKSRMIPNLVQIRVNNESSIRQYCESVGQSRVIEQLDVSIVANPNSNYYTGLKIASNWSPWVTKNRPGLIERMTREPNFYFYFYFFLFFFLFFFRITHYRYYYLKTDEKLVKFHYPF